MNCRINIDIVAIKHIPIMHVLYFNLLQMLKYFENFAYHKISLRNTINGAFLVCILPADTQ